MITEPPRKWTAKSALTFLESEYSLLFAIPRNNAKTKFLVLDRTSLIDEMLVELNKRSRPFLDEHQTDMDLSKKWGSPDFANEFLAVFRRALENNGFSVNPANPDTEKALSANLIAIPLDHSEAMESVILQYRESAKNIKAAADFLGIPYDKSIAPTFILPTFGDS